jgi:hypothetical protein
MHNPYFDNSKLIGLLNNNGIAPVDGAFLVEEHNGSAVMSEINDPRKLWKLFEKAHSVREWRPDDFLTVRLGGAGSSATIRVNSHDRMSLKLVEGEPSLVLPQIFDGYYCVPGLYNAVSQTNSR